MSGECDGQKRQTGCSVGGPTWDLEGEVRCCIEREDGEGEGKEAQRGELLIVPTGALKVVGKGGGDTLIGYDGNDTYYVRVTSDQVIETPTGGVWDTVYAYVDFTLPANVEAMVLNLNTLHGTGNAAANALYAQGASDVLTGGGGGDIFLLHAGFGNASITDFKSAEGDIIDLHNTFSTFGQLQANTQQVGANAVITWTGQDVLTLQNVTASLLTAADFHLS